MAKEKLTETEKLFRKGARHNWDKGYTALYKIVRDEHCDKGTALMLYWMSRPEWFRQYSNSAAVPDYERDNYLFVQFVREHFPNISREEIIYDPREAEEVGLYDRDFVPKVELPAIMYEKTGGTIHYKEVLKK